MGKRWIASGFLLLLVAAAGCGGAKQARTAPGPEPSSEGPVAGEPEKMPRAPQTVPNGGGPAPAPRCTVPEPAAKPGYMTLYVYFTCEDDPLPAQPRRVPRQVPETKAVLHAALEELLKGPTEQERAVGLHSWFSARTAGKLQEAAVKDGERAVVDFQNFAQIIPNASTSAGSSMLIQEVGHTIFQFGEVQRAEVRFAGSCEAFWGWLQRDCQVLEAANFR